MMKPLARTSPLVFHGRDNPETGNLVVSKQSRPLWLAVHLPWLAGEVLDPGKQFLAVSEESRRGWVVYQASAGARRQGVCPGMTVSAAHVICPGLVALQRQPLEEKRRLDQIGEWMKSFSPIVSVQAPATVLMEIRGSLFLFGGLEQFKTLIRQQLDNAGHVYRFAGAPTPLAAKYLARWGRGVVVEDKSALRSTLGAMAVELMDLDSKTIKRLRQAGIRTLRDLWRLPPDGLARRFGTGLVRQLDSLQGMHPDPQPLYESPLHFSSTLMLDWATDDLARVKQGVECLLRQWVGYLRRSGRATSGFTVECLPERGSDTVRVEIGLRHITRDMDHLRTLCSEKLDRLELAQPVAGLVLSSDHLHPFHGSSGQLFETDSRLVDRRVSQYAWGQSEELLAARLNGQGLDTLHTVAEHRPEYAWSRTPNPLSTSQPVATRSRRPLWLLDIPRLLPQPGSGFSAGRTRCCRNQTRIVTGPERIETGWWDLHDQRRDYYIATDSKGRRLWIYQDLKHRQWYLHGLFA